MKISLDEYPTDQSKNNKYLFYYTFEHGDCDLITQDDCEFASFSLDQKYELLLCLKEIVQNRYKISQIRGMKNQNDFLLTIIEKYNFPRKENYVPWELLNIQHDVFNSSQLALLVDVKLVLHDEKGNKAQLVSIIK